jgi:hypothetical protein
MSFGHTTAKAVREIKRKGRRHNLNDNDATKAVFGYTNECQTTKNYKIFKDDEVLRDLVHGQNTMLYVFLPGVHAQGISFWNRGVKIYN